MEPISIITITVLAMPRFALSNITVDSTTWNCPEIVTTERLTDYLWYSLQLQQNSVQQLHSYRIWAVVVVTSMDDLRIFYLVGGGDRGSPRRQEGGGGLDLLFKIPEGFGGYTGKRMKQVHQYSEKSPRP